MVINSTNINEIQINDVMINDTCILHFTFFGNLSLSRVASPLWSSHAHTDLQFKTNIKFKRLPHAEILCHMY
jgi:hypothetical protein